MSDSNQSVNLGCGTLIMIALIVMFFSHRNDNQNQIASLRSDVQELTEEVRSLRVTIMAGAAEAEVPAAGGHGDAAVGLDAVDE